MALSALSGVTALTGLATNQYSMISPMMTSNTEPAPYVVSASSFYPAGDSYAPWRMFDNGGDLAWAANFVSLPHWVEFDLGEIWKINRIVIRKYSHPVQSLRDWSVSLKQSAGDTYKQVDSVSAIEPESFPYAHDFPSTLGRFIRLDITQQNSLAAIGYMEIYGRKP